MDARNVRFGETNINQLIQWLRQTNTPQTLETITQRYVEILKASVRTQEEE
jgi:hypothetical protein